MTRDDEKVGYRNPPKASRFKKGKSGNPNGRPKKQKPKQDMKSMLERVANEEIEVGGQTMTMHEVELRALQRKAAKGDVAASRHLAKLRTDAGFNSDKDHITGVLVVPPKMGMQDWAAMAEKQQAPFRENREGSKRDDYSDY